MLLTCNRARDSRGLLLEVFTLSNAVIQASDCRSFSCLDEILKGPRGLSNPSAEMDSARYLSKGRC